MQLVVYTYGVVYGNAYTTMVCDRAYGVGKLHNPENKRTINSDISMLRTCRLKNA